MSAGSRDRSGDRGGCGSLVSAPYERGWHGHPWPEGSYMDVACGVPERRVGRTEFPQLVPALLRYPA